MKLFGRHSSPASHINNFSFFCFKLKVTDDSLFASGHDVSEDNCRVNFNGNYCYRWRVDSCGQSLYPIIKRRSGAREKKRLLYSLIKNMLIIT